jgi:hypothetical protein
MFEKEFSQQPWPKLTGFLKPGGKCTHIVDYKDHLQNSMNNLRFGDSFWEKDWVAKSGFYTNRIHISEMKQIFKNLGFSVQVLEVNKWGSIPISRRHIHKQFAYLSDSDLQAFGATFLLIKD